jgi:hypothetical protein
MRITRARRFTLAAVGWAIAWMLLHPFVANALCARGDEFLRRGDPHAALRYYARAMRIDSGCAVAVERFTFSALELRTLPDLRAATAAADTYLARHGSNAEIETDRALVLWAAGDEPRAAIELRNAGRTMHDARLLRLATIAERRFAEAALQ